MQRTRSWRHFRGCARPHARPFDGQVRKHSAVDARCHATWAAGGDVRRTRSAEAYRGAQGANGRSSDGPDGTYRGVEHRRTGFDLLFRWSGGWDGCDRQPVQRYGIIRSECAGRQGAAAVKPVYRGYLRASATGEFRSPTRLSRGFRFHMHRLLESSGSSIQSSAGVRAALRAIARGLDVLIVEHRLAMRAAARAGTFRQRRDELHRLYGHGPPSWGATSHEPPVQSGIK